MYANDDVDILNDLIWATLDSARHYRRVAGNIGSLRIRAVFDHLSTQRSRVAQTLQHQVATFGGVHLADGFSVIHTTHVFGNLRYAMDYGYCALIDEVERGEEHVKAKYECALENERLSQLSRTVVMSVYPSVREGFDEMHALKRYPNDELIHDERLRH